MSNFYAVVQGRRVGVFNSWKECEKQVKGYSGAVFRKFSSEHEANDFIKENTKKIKKQKEKKKDIESRRKPLIGEENRGMLNDDDLFVIERSKKYIKKSEKVFDFKKDEAVTYVDGSYSNDLVMFSYGIVYFDDKGKRALQGRGRDKHLIGLRSVAGELKSAAVAMQLAINEGKKTLYIYFDYIGIEKWATKEWGANNPGARAYQEYYDSIKKKLNVVFIEVTSKTGVKYHDEADRLATWAMTNTW